MIGGVATMGKDDDVVVLSGGRGTLRRGLNEH